jgi:hypothetical protein
MTDINNTAASTVPKFESQWKPMALRMKPLENPAIPPKKLMSKSAVP